MARLARIALLATLLIAAAALAACGDDNTEKNRYVRELTAAQERYQAEATKIDTNATATSTPTQDRRTLDRFADAIADAIAALRRIDAPPKLAAEHRRFIDVYLTWHEDVESFVRAIKTPTRRGLERAQRRIAAASLTFNESVREAGTDIDAKLAS